MADGLQDNKIYIINFLLVYLFFFYSLCFFFVCASRVGRADAAKALAEHGACEPRGAQSQLDIAVCLRAPGHPMTVAASPSESGARFINDGLSKSCANTDRRGLKS